MRRHFLLLFLFIIPFWGSAQNNSLVFNKISNANGLSNNSINCIFQDSRGFIWFGTLNGLNRFDGNDFVIFRNDPQNKASISSNIITSIQEDADKKLWIGTTNGINIYDPVTQKFENYNNNPDQNKALLIHSAISTLYATNKFIWVGTRDKTTKDKGLYSYNKLTKTFDSNPLTNFTLTDNKINCIGQDDHNHLWIGTSRGLNCATLNNDKITALNHFYNNVSDKNSISNDKINTIYKDNDNTLWVGTSNGLNKLIDDGNVLNIQPRFIRYNFNMAIAGSLSHNDVTVIFEDNDGELWVGTDGGGLNCASLHTNRASLNFAHYQRIPENNNSLVQNQVFSMIQDASGVLWVGTINGIDRITKSDNEFHLFQNNPLLTNSIPNNNVAAIQAYNQQGNEYLLLATTGGLTIGVVKDIQRQKKEFIPITDASGELDARKFQCIFLLSPKIALIGTKINLRIFDLEKRRFLQTPAGLQALPKSVIRHIYRDKTGLIWIGTNQGLYVWDAVKQQLKGSLVTQSVNSHKNADFIGTNYNNDIFAIAEDSQNDIWVGTWGRGLIKFKAGHPENTPVLYNTNTTDPNSLSSNYVTALQIDKKGRLWIGTTEGLNLLQNASSNKFAHYNTHNGFNNNYIAGILEDNKANLWIASLTGISKFNPQNHQVLNFNFQYGNLTRENYSIGTAKDAEGYMYFGGINGLLAFHPDSIKEDKHQYPIALTDFQVFNRDQTAADPAANNNSTHLSATISGGAISLNHEQYGFSFAFASLNYKIADRISYAYKLQGIDNNWIYRSANQRFASYSNLNPGTYVLKVMATNEYGLWSAPADLLTITVLTPWWKTWWAYILYTIAICLSIYLLGVYVLEKERLKNNLNLERLEKEKVKEVDELKFRYFTNISHEFRTPLTLILGPLEQLYKSLPLFNDNVKGNLLLIQHNVNHLLRLINQLLDFRKAEEGSLRLEAWEADIIDFLNEIKDSFEPLAHKKSLTFKVNHQESSIIGWCDFDKLEKILNNLIYNALSFTPENGMVSIGVSTIQDSGSRKLHLKIRDNGEGISSGDIDKIFNTFYQASNQKRSFSSGYGIGLSLTKQLIDLHKGTITVSSEPLSGTIFDITLPIDRKAYQDSEIATHSKEVINKHLFVFEGEDNDATELIPTDKDVKKPLLLLVDDNPDIRKYLINCFKDKYRLLQAADGMEGLEKAAANNPDLIISDVMMPVMDGKEFCYKIKTTLSTSHIPVILLTALMSTEQMIEGLETGADAYVTKPFHYDVLDLQVKNLIESRRKLRRHFVNDAITQPKEVTVNSVDEVFLAKAMKVVESNIKDPDYSVDQFVDDMAIGRSVLYRKLKQITDQSPNEFIRTVRLKRAAQLLRKHTGNITEIGYEVGFIDPGYFTRCFKKQFGVTPKDFVNERTEVKDDSLA